MVETRSSRLVIEREFVPQMEALHRYALFLTRDRTAAEELTQETLLRAIKSVELYEPGSNAKGWLFKIMTNLRHNQNRKRTYEVEFTDTMSADADENDATSAFVEWNKTPEESFVNHLSRTKVREAIERLPSEFRSVVVLADLEEFAYREIAEIVGCPIGTVMSRLFRGRRMLKDQLMGYARDMGWRVDAASRGPTIAAHTDQNASVTDLAAFRHGRRVEAAGQGGSSDEV